VILGTTQTAVGFVVLFATLVLGITYAFLNVRSSRPEAGSEIELAPNRKPYLDDEELEGRKLDRTLTYGLLGIFVIAIGLPLYWLNEPSRQAGEIKDTQSQFVNRGAAMFDTTANGGFNCAFCHGGMKATGGEADYTITDANGQFVQAVKWKAPALNTVLQRYSRAEVRYVLTYGRPYSPMPAWGLLGGGPLNDQQLQNLIDYLESIQITPKQSQAAIPKAIKSEMKAAEEAGHPYSSEGAALFNLGLYSNFAGGAYACARCHTTGWSYGQPSKTGTGSLGPPLSANSLGLRFPGDVQGTKEQIDFVCSGSTDGQRYGQNGQGTGRMPGFCQTPEEKINPGEVGTSTKDPSDPVKVGGMLTQKMVAEIVQYERSL
jgi:mono/diheme cytochrome c family protein